MQSDENLTHIREARKAAYDIFLAIEEEEKNRKSLYFWKNMIKFFFYSVILLVCIIGISNFLLIK